jgi:hypothetical protein
LCYTAPVHMLKWGQAKFVFMNPPTSLL